MQTTLGRRQIGAFSFSLTRYDAEAVLPWHEHAAAYLTFVIDGGYCEAVRGATRECSPRTVVYHPAGERHHDRFGTRATACLDLHFGEAWLDGVRARGCGTDQPAIVDSPAASRVASCVLREFQQSDGLSPLAIESLLLELFVEKQRRAEAQPAPWLRRVRERLDVANVSLTELAHDAGVHPTHLARAFRAHYGCTIGDFVRARRIELAKRRLASRAPLATIALDLGFADQSHFSRTFRRFTGQTPAAYRRALR